MTPTMQILRRALRATSSHSLRPLPLLFPLLLLVARGTGPSPATPDAAPAGHLVAPVAAREERLRGLDGAIERAFARCDARLLEPALPRRVKLYLSAPSLGIDEAYYGPGQAVVLLRRACEGRTTLRFTPLGPWRRLQDEAEAARTVRWVSRSADGAEDDIRIAFAYAPEGMVWSIREIRELK